MSATLARAPEVEPTGPTPIPLPGILDAGVISLLGRGRLPEVELAAGPAAAAATGPASRRARRAGRAPLPPAAGVRPGPSPRAPRPLPRPLPVLGRGPAVAPADAAPPAGLPDLPAWLTSRLAPARPAAATAAPVVPRAPAPRAAPAARSRRRRLVPIGAAVLGVAALAALASAAGLRVPLPGSGGPEVAPAAADPLAPTAAARREIPPAYLRLYVRIGRAQDIDWRFLAAIGAQESDHGRNPAAGRINPSGCVGPMQVGVGGDCGDFLAAWGTDGDGDGRVDPRDPADAIATAARGLREGKGAPGVGGPYLAYYHAACGYYGACADARADYAADVMARAVRYGFPAPG